MTTANVTDKQSHTEQPASSATTKARLTDRLSDLGLVSDLYLSLNYHYVKVPKSGFIAKFKKQKEALDIDLACALFDKNGQQLDLIYYKNLRDNSEAIIHYGDQLTGFRLPRKTEKQAQNATKQANAQTDISKDDSEQDSLADASKKTAEDVAKDTAKDIEKSLALSPMDLESIHILLAKLPEEVHHVALIASSFQNHPLCQVPIGYIDLEDVEGNIALHVNLTYLPKDCTSLWLASLVRTADFVYRDDKSYQDWQFIKKEAPLPHTKIEELVQYIQL